MSDNSNSNSSVIYTGRVKWFNNKAGYGFITVTDSAVSGQCDNVKSGTDVFVHYSKISLANKQYSYLIQGEYVNFQLEFFETGVHKIQASNVTGINGGKLMCETRREFRLARNSYREQHESQDQPETAVQMESPVGPPPKGNSVDVPRAPLRTRAPRSTNMESKPSAGRGGGGRGSGTGRGRGRPSRQTTNTTQA